MQLRSRLAHITERFVERVVNSHIHMVNEYATWNMENGVSFVRKLIVGKDLRDAWEFTLIYEKQH